MRLQQLDNAQMTAYSRRPANLWAVVSNNSLKAALRTPLLLALFRVGFEGAEERG